MMKREWFSIGIHLGYRYESSPIIVPDETPEPPDTVMTYEQTARPGHRAPHAWLAPGRSKLSTLDLFGHTFTLLYFKPDSSAPEPYSRISPLEVSSHATPKEWSPSMTAWQHAARRRGLRLTEFQITSPEIAELYENRLVLVRPDGHVCWRGEDEPADIGRLLDTVRGAA